MNILENLQHNVVEFEFHGLDVSEYRERFEDELGESLMDVVIYIENVHESVEDLAMYYLEECVNHCGLEGILNYLDLKALGEDILHDMSNVLIEERAVLCDDGRVEAHIDKIVKYSVQ